MASVDIVRDPVRADYEDSSPLVSSATRAALFAAFVLRTQHGITLTPKILETDLMSNQVPSEITTAQARLEKLSNRSI